MNAHFRGIMHETGLILSENQIGTKNYPLKYLAAKTNTFFWELVALAVLLADYNETQIYMSFNQELRLAIVENRAFNTRNGPFEDIVAAVKSLLELMEERAGSRDSASRLAEKSNEHTFVLDSGRLTFKLDVINNPLGIRGKKWSEIVSGPFNPRVVAAEFFQRIPSHPDLYIVRVWGEEFEGCWTEGFADGVAYTTVRHSSMNWLRVLLNEDREQDA